jgi:Fic family protein
MRMFPYRADTLLERCRELDRWRTRLDYKGPLPRAWVGRIRRDLEAEAVAASTSMEGVPVTVNEVRRILAGDPPAGVSDENRGLVEGYRDAMEFVLRRADDHNFLWNSELLAGLHDRVLARRYSRGAGRVRTRSVFIADRQTGREVFRPPDGDAVPALVNQMCGIMEQRTRESEAPEHHPAILAAWLHVATAAVHPYQDGNGRVARVLASLAMYRCGFKRREFTSLEEWWGRHLPDYYAAFRCLGAQFDQSADVTPFIETHISAQLSQIRSLDLREQVERRVWTAIENLVSELGIEPRLVNAAYDAFFDRDVTARYYRSLTDVSPATATHDLTAGLASGLLRAEGQRRSRRYRAGPRLYQGVAQAIGIDVEGPDEVARETVVTTLATRIADGPA